MDGFARAGIAIAPLALPPSRQKRSPSTHAQVSSTNQLNLLPAECS
ncbi:MULTISPECIES: hypothetical protein [unclassified Microcoleus]